MKVGFDGQVAAFQPTGGITSYFKTLARSFGHMGVKNIQVREKAISSQTATLIHLTFYIPFYPSTFSRLPKVVTVYDFIPETQSGFRKRHAHLAKDWYIKNSDGVIYISETVRRQAEERGYKPNIWAVTPLASRFKLDDSKNIPSRNKKEFLFIGNRESYKNFELIPKALTNTKSTEIQLTIVGGKKLRKSELRQLGSLGINFQHLTNVADDELEALYLRAGGCLIPSLQEGFGLPMIEAMSLGCPVIALDTEITNEVGGDAVIKIKESDPKSWASAIDSLISDEQLWKAHSLAGIERSKLFSWEKTAELTANLYKRVLEESGGDKR